MTRFSGSWHPARHAARWARAFAAALLACPPMALAQVEPLDPPVPFLDRAEVRGFIEEAVERHGLDRRALESAFAQARHQRAVVRAMEPGRPGERSWRAYRGRYVHPTRIDQGARFWARHARTLARAASTFGVPEEIIVAIIGIETVYGQYTGSWRVLDALATLAFDYPRRAPFFRGELESLFVYARETGTDLAHLRGSYAGAIGIAQFMPGSFLRHAIDFDGDGKRDLIASTADAIGSVGNFLKAHGWKPGEPVALRARATGTDHLSLVHAGIEPAVRVEDLPWHGVHVLGIADPEARCALIELETPGEPAELRVGFENFYVITRYNQSSFYAMAVFDLANAIRLEHDRRLARNTP